MGTKLQARILHTLAANDTFDGVGRIFLWEAQRATRNPELTVEAILDYWREYYPAESAEEKQPDLILVYFDGKESLRNLREFHRSNYIPRFDVAPAKEETYRAENEYPDPDETPANKPVDNIIW